MCVDCIGEQDQQRPPKLPVPFPEKSRRMDGTWQKICTESYQQTLSLQKLSLTRSLELHIDFSGNMSTSIESHSCDPPHPLSPKYCHFTSALCSCQNQAEDAREWRAKLLVCLNVLIFFFLNGQITKQVVSHQINRLQPLCQQAGLRGKPATGVTNV